MTAHPSPVHGGLPGLGLDAGGIAIDASRSAKAQDNKVLYLILQCTVADFPLSMKVLTEDEVSARHPIRPDRILGHGEVTAANKEDPAPRDGRHG